MITNGCKDKSTVGFMPRYSALWLRRGRLNVPAIAVGLDPYEAELEDRIVAGWKAFSPEIDITAFATKSKWGSDRILACVHRTHYNHPEIFYLSHVGGLRKKWWSRGPIVNVSLIGIEYDFKPDEYDTRKRKLDSVVAKIMSCLQGINGDVEKALFLHDYLVRCCDYDIVAKGENDHTCLARTAYSALVRGRAVCEGYAMAYRYLLNAARIVSDVAISESMGHIWNYVRIHGRWYHVDVTYDDPVCVNGFKPGRKISRKHFLMSDKKAEATGHMRWDVRGLPPACDQRYDAQYL